MFGARNTTWRASRFEIWRAESPGNKYPLYFAPYPAMMTGDWKEASRLMDEALQLVPNDPLIISLQGLLHALMGNREAAIACVTKACSSPKSFGHAHHTYYQIACTLALTGRRDTAFEWLERSVSTGFACWPFFLKDPCLASLRSLPEFELLISCFAGQVPGPSGTAIEKQHQCAQAAENTIYLDAKHPSQIVLPRHPSGDDGYVCPGEWEQ